MKIFRNEFLKWHLSFIVPYICTYIIGRLRGTSALASKLHPWFAVATFIIPLIVYLLSKNKRLIRQMIKSNFSLKCKPLMRVARVTTLIIMFYFLFSLMSGIMMAYGWYGTIPIYKFIRAVHRFATYLVPLVVLTHAGARLLMKKNRNKR